MPGSHPSDEAEAYRLLMADVYELASAARRTSDRVAARHGQSVARWHVMSVVAEEEVSVPGVASRLGLTRQSVQRVVDRLAADGLVARRDNPRHRASPLVGLTPAGRRVLDRLVADADADREAMLAAGGVHRRDLLAARQTVRTLLALLRSRG
ncbi:MarR family winged helix-turn-helix transcriptional regulator [Georgenia alba]|uniref:MarR family winged helix-turn-helix transcriptional regulator n=1 Tax=Georgenia alba TaxID=2233858 RepID=A0ABW2Q4E2_9MICO